MKEYVYSQQERIYLLDDIFSFAERSYMYEFTLNSKFKFERGAYPFPEAGSNVYQLMCKFNNEDVENFKFFINDKLKNFLSEFNLSVESLETARLNACLSSDTYQVHVDRTSVKNFTLLYFVNLDWKTDWEGETTFMESNARDIFCSISFVPGRVILFNSTIPHKSSQPSFNAPYHRFVFNCVFKQNEITN